MNVVGTNIEGSCFYIQVTYYFFLLSILYYLRKDL